MEKRIAKIYEVLSPVGGIYLQYAADGKLGVEAKAKNDFVTRADREIETLITQAVLADFPQDSIVQEEHADVNGGSAYKWVIDPIDGTNNYARNILDARIQIALLQNNRIMFGIIYNPLTEEAYMATAGQGAYHMHLQNGQKTPLRVSRRPIADSLIIFTAGIAGGKEDTSRIFNALLGKVGAIRIYGCAAIAFELIASGRADGFICDIAKPMDMAPGALIVREAFGKATNFNGDDWLLDMADIVVGNAVNSQSLINLVR